MTREKIVRDCIRLEIAALLSLARDGKSVFLQDILAKAAPVERDWIRSELKKLEVIIRTKVEAHDEA